MSYQIRQVGSFQALVTGFESDLAIKDWIEHELPNWSFKAKELVSPSGEYFIIEPEAQSVSKGVHR